MASKIEKTIARQQEKIAEGQFYEAQQQLRVIASRYVKQENWDAAIDVLFGGASALLKAGQGGSGGDLCLYMVDVYNKAELKPGAGSKGKVLALLRAFPHGEPTRKRFVVQAIEWSSRFGEFPNGDPELHHVTGSLYVEDNDPYDAERHLALGTIDSPEQLAQLEYDWYAQDDSHTAALYAARAIFPYLLTGNLRFANKALLIFNSRLSASAKSLNIQEVSSASSDMRVYPSIPLLNFLGLLLMAIQRGSADLFRQLAKHYAPYIKEVGAWDEALAQVGETYFGIKIPRQGNPLFDMMGSMLFGGGGGSPKPATSKSSTPSQPKKVDVIKTPAPPAPDLD